MNSPLYTVQVPPRQPRVTATPSVPRSLKPEPPGDDLRKLAFQIAQHDPVLAHLLVRAGERIKRN